jgi:disulfide bond formation protein DsbB
LLNSKRALLSIFAVTLAVILGAFSFEYLGYAPCELCLMQRYAYYAVIPVSLLLTFASPNLQRGGLYIIGVIMLASMVFGIFHSGVEWKFWEGPTTCTGKFGGGLPDLTKKAVMCDQPAIRIIGLSLAGWNAIISAAVSWFAFIKAYGSSSASQYR